MKLIEQQQKRHSVASDNTSSPGNRPHLPTDSRHARQIARRRLIADYVNSRQSARIDEISKRFGISLMTVHRDIDTLVEDGLVSKSRGVITSRTSAAGLAEPADTAATDAGDYQAIAAAAADLIQPGQTVFLAGSPILRHAARHLASKVPLTIVTNSLDLMNDFRELPDISLIGLGGTFKSWSGCFHGPQTIREINDIDADAAIVSADAIFEEKTFYETEEDLAVRNAMQEKAKRIILVASHGMFDKKAFYGGNDLRDYDAVVVNSAVPPLLVDRMLSRKIHVRLA